MDSQRSPARFEAFYRRNRSWSRVYMRRRLQGTGEDWESLWNTAWANFSAKYLDPETEFEKGPSAYLKVCLRNTASDALRKRFAAEPTLSLDEYKEVQPRGAVIPEPSLGEWHDPALVSALAKLSPRQRAIIEYWSWMSPRPTDQELADEFGFSLSTAKTHKRRALERLRQMLGMARSMDVPPDAREGMK